MLVRSDAVRLSTGGTSVSLTNKDSASYEKTPKCCVNFRNSGEYFHLAFFFKILNRQGCITAEKPRKYSAAVVLLSLVQGWGDQSASNVLADDNLSPLRAPLIVSRSQETREAKGSIASLRDGLSEAVAGGHHVMDSMYDMADVIQRGGEVHVNGGDLPLLLAELQMQRARERLQELRDLYLEVSKEIAHDPAALRQTAAAYAEQEQQQLETVCGEHRLPAGLWICLGVMCCLETG